MSFEFTASESTIRQLFKNYTSFEIPSFQRDYSWNASYYSTFFDDIIDSISSDDSENYFIGTMVFSNPNTVSKVDVIDGQQRLTTMTILFSALSYRFKTIGEKSLSEATFRYVSDSNDDGDDVPRLMSQSSSPFIDSYIQVLDSDKNILSPDTSEEYLLKNAYDNMYEWLSEDDLNKHDSISSLSYVEKLKKIRDQLLGSSIISILSQNKDTAYKVFEILNAKGMDLTDLDLIKNYIFEQINADPTTVNTLQKVAFDLWNKIKYNLRERELDVDLTLFYRDFWLSKYQKVSKKQLFDSFKNIMGEKSDKEYIEFLSELETESKNYVLLVNPNNSDFKNKQQFFPLVQGLKNLAILGNRQYIIVMTALLFLKNNEKISLNEFIKAVNFIESFTFMFSTLKHGQTNIFENVFSKLAIALRKSKDKSNTHQILTQELYNNPKLLENMSTIEEFTKEFTQLQFTKRYSKLNMISQYVVKKITQSFEDKQVSDFSVEHILSESMGGESVLNIGNLIGLERYLNDKAKDLPYKNKKDIYGESAYQQVKVFLTTYDEFDENTIKSRANKLATYYYNEILSKDLMLK
ncbi:DUF262 domain-containing protein [Leuconostoc suionicum]|uniref:DUF262 domain-containing protein n=1 Tax=Leuconostoc suionicum TaxID=1511761 RepID=UPI0032DF79E4